MSKKTAILFFTIGISILLGLSCSYYSELTAYYNTLYNAKEEFKKGVELYLQNKDRDIKSRTDRKYFENTIEKCWKLIEFHGYDNKYSDDAILLIAKSEYYLNKFVSSKKHLDAFSEKFPTSELMPEAFLWKAKCNLALGDTTTAMSQLNESLVKAKNNELKAEIFLQYAEISFSEKKYEEASEYYKKAMKAAQTKTQRSLIQFYLAESYFNTEDYKSASDNYKKVIKNPPNEEIEYLATLHLAISLSKRDKANEAIQILNRMLTASRFKKYYGEVYAELGNIYWELGDAQSAIFYYKEGIATKSGEGAAKSAYYLGEKFEKYIGNVDSAVIYYQMLPRLKRDSPFTKSAQEKINYLQAFQKVKKIVDYERRFIQRWQNDPVFKDSVLYQRKMDSLYSYRNKDYKFPDFKTYLRKLSKLDTADLFYNENYLNYARSNYPQDSAFILFRLDSIMGAYSKDSLIALDSISFPKSDSLANLYFNYEKEKKIFAKLKETKNMENRSIDQIEEDFKKHYLEYADFFLLETSFIDSARIHYLNFLNMYQDSTYTPKALYSLYYIYQFKIGDSLKADSVKNVLITTYPESDFARSFSMESGQSVETENQIESQSRNSFILAENHYLNQSYDSALTYLNHIITSDTSSEWHQKALYLKGYIYEKYLDIPDSAIQIFTYLSEKFPQSPYGKQAKIRITEPEDVTVASLQDREEDTQDSQKESKVEQAQEFVYSEADKAIIIENIETLMNQDYLRQAEQGEFKRFWSKKVLRDFLNELQ